ncbi:MAG: tetratricopeptide repeat protein [Pyrinomonadaceae bacterium]
MLPKSIAHYCQKCLAANPFGQELCGRCGTRLMLVVEPPATRFESNGSSAQTPEEYLLERVSALENMLLRITERMERTLDLMLQQANNSQREHALVQSLIDILNEAGAISADEVDMRWIENCRKHTAEFEQNNRYKKLGDIILAAYQGTEKGVFTKCVDEAVHHLGKKELTSGIRELERAAALAADNAPLNSFLGEYFFDEGKHQLAHDYLQRAFRAGTNAGSSVPLLLGIACGDLGDVKQAVALIEAWIKNHQAASFSAPYALGKLFAYEDRWREALAEFKKALAARPCAEMNYVMGCVYYKLERDGTAERHLRKAIALDENYAAAHFALGVVLLRTSGLAVARKSFNAACVAGDPDATAYQRVVEEISRTKKRTFLQTIMMQFFAAPGSKSAAEGIITGGSTRLALLVRTDALKRFVTPQIKEAN